MNTPTPENTKKSVSARRRLFQILAVGGTAAVVLPEKWVKPAVDAVIVPAHAAGSVVRVSGVFGNNGSNRFGDNGRGGMLERFAGLLMSSANAATAPPGTLTNPNTICISFEIAATPPYAVQVVAGRSSFTTTLNPDNTINDVTVGSLIFTSLRATSLRVNGTVSTPAPNSISEDFSFPPSSACVVLNDT